MVDFEETERERDRCQHCDHRDVGLFGLEDLLCIAAVALLAQMRVSGCTNMGCTRYVSRTGF